MCHRAGPVPELGGIEIGAAVALHHLEQMTQPTLTRLAAYDRLDAATRIGHLDSATRWPSELEEFVDATDTPRAHRVVAYGRALLAAHENSPAAAEAFFTQAIGADGAEDRTFEQARTHLAYGGFLRRSRRRVDAREQLRASLHTFIDLGAAPWIQRAEQELRASGETARKRDAASSVALTAQETQVATFIAEGLSNREVAAKLFLSPRTIDFHLRNVSPRRASPHGRNSPGSPSSRCREPRGIPGRRPGGFTGATTTPDRDH